MRKHSGEIQGPETFLSPGQLLAEGIHCLQINDAVQIPTAIVTTAGLPISALVGCVYDALLEGARFRD